MLARPLTFFFFTFLVLDRVQTFLPLMAEADEKLKQDIACLPAGSLDIENVEHDHTHVEMVSIYSLCPNQPQSTLSKQTLLAPTLLLSVTYLCELNSWSD